MVKVFHYPRIASTVVPHCGEEELKAFAHDVFKIYHHVADVFSKDLNDAFRLTNHIDSHWWVNKEVKTIKESRSTSVGDVLQLGDEFFVVAPIGFTKLDKNIIKKVLQAQPKVV